MGLNTQRSFYAFFIAYSASFLFYGAHITGLGPYIPYLASQSGQPETKYSYLFSCRSLGMLAGAVMVKYFQNYRKCNNHQLILTASLAVFICFTLFSVAASHLWLGLWMTLGSVFYSFLEILLNVSILSITPHEKTEFWLMITHGVFGVGGLVGPLCVWLFEYKAFLVMGLCLALCSPFYCIISTPKTTKNLQQLQGQQISQREKVSTRGQVLLCLAFFAYLGMETSFGGWISSYTILSGVSTKEKATAFSTVYWGSMTVFRLILAFVPGTSSQKMKWLLVLTICFSVGCLGLIRLGHVEATCYLSGVLFGLSCSSLYPLVFSICSEFRLTLKEGQSSNLLACGVLGEGLLTMIAGQLMHGLHINMLFVWMGLLAATMLALRRFVMVELTQKSISSKNELITELLQVKRSVSTELSR